MYEAVRAAPEGESTVARLAATAADYGFDGVVVRNHPDAVGAGDADRIREAYGVDVVDGAEIVAPDPSHASGHLGRHRDERTIVAVRGGTSALNRFAVDQPRVDVLSRPLDGDGEVDHVLARRAAENGVRIEVNLAGVLRGRGGARVREIEALRTLREVLSAYDAPFVVSGEPASHLALRAPRDLVAVGETIGFDREEIESGLAEWARLAERNRDRRSDSFVEPGVRRGPHDSGKDRSPEDDAPAGEGDDDRGGNAP